ncbi:MAG: FixH family protein [Armatimonadota bacterium]
MKAWLRLIAVSQLALFIALISWAGQDRQTTNDASPDDALVQQGRQLFLANCAMCHGINAQSHCPMVPSLVGVTERMSPSEIIAHSRGLVSRMCCARHLAQLSDQDYHAIVAYLRTLKPTTETHLQSPPKMAMGMQGCPMMGGMAHSNGHENQTHRHQPSPTKSPSLFPQTRTSDDLTVTFALQPDPPRVGDNKLQVRLTDVKGQPVIDAKVQVKFSMPNMRMAGPTVSLRHDKNGVYIGSVLLGMEGAWRAEVTVQRSDKKPIVVTFDFIVPVASVQEKPTNLQPPPPPPQNAVRRKGCC